MISKAWSKLLVLLGACVAVQTVHASNWDLEYWQNIVLKNWEQDPYKLSTTVEIRAHDDLHKVYYYHITEGLAYQALSWLTLEAHYTFIYDIPTEGTKFRNSNRLELEINPSMDLENGFNLSWRNRYELEKKQHNPKLESIFRQRVALSCSPSDRGSLKKIACANEFFYDLNDSRFTQNRCYPLILSFELTKESSVNWYVMVRNFAKTSTDRWFQSIVLGSDLAF